MKSSRIDFFLLIFTNKKSIVAAYSCGIKGGNGALGNWDSSKMTIHYENDAVHLREAVKADVIGEKRLINVEAGAIGTAVLVHGEPMKPLAYEVEFYIQDQDCYVLATIDAEKLVP